MRILKKLFAPLTAALAALQFMSPLPLSAARNFANYAILAQADSPVFITLCRAWISDTTYGNINYYINAAMSFRNQFLDNIVAIRFRYDLYSTFDEHLGSLYGSKEGTYSPRALIEPRGNIMGLTLPDFSWINIHDNATQIQCSVATVKFANGLVWQASKVNGANASGLNSGGSTTETSVAIKKDSTSSAVAVFQGHPISCKVSLKG